MAEFKLVMPRMGESVEEATIITWHKKVGDSVEEDETVLEVATDKVDSDVPSPVSGTIKELLHQPDAVVKVGDILAIIEVEGVKKSEDRKEKLEEKSNKSQESRVKSQDTSQKGKKSISEIIVEPKTPELIKEAQKIITPPPIKAMDSTEDLSGRYYSPLVLNVARIEGISMSTLESLPGTGRNGRVTKNDILAYVANMNQESGVRSQEPNNKSKVKSQKSKVAKQKEVKLDSKVEPLNDEIIAMDRMRKLIANHMIHSKQTSAHVSSFVEADMTNVVNWRNKHKNKFHSNEGFKLSFMPIIVEAVAKAIKDFPMINISVQGENIIKKKSINIGVATALPSGNLIVPVIKNTDQLNLSGIAHEMNSIVVKARNNKLQPDDTQGGTYTISNIGTFGNILGTPIINQPQVAILAVGSITKKAIVVETEVGDVIAIRHMMYLSHTYDHRIVDGALGGMFVKRVAEYLEGFDVDQEV